MSFTSAEMSAREGGSSSKNGEVDPAVLGLKVTGIDVNIEVSNKLVSITPTT